MYRRKIGLGPTSSTPWDASRFRYAPVTDFTRLAGGEPARDPTIFITFHQEAMEQLTGLLAGYEVFTEIYPPGKNYLWKFKRTLKP